jgi:drug/metabolite transporter (DMT)-like permease
VPEARANRRGIFALVCGMAAFSMNDALIKLAGRVLPFGEIIFIRGAVTVFCLGAAILSFGHGRLLTQAATAPVMLRGIFDSLASGFFIAALMHMQIAEISAVVLTSPLVMTALAVLIYGEEVGWRRWLAIGMGLAGALFVAKPSPEAFNIWALLGLAAAVAAAARDLTTRRINPAISTLAITFFSSIAVTMSGFVIGFDETWRWPEPGDLALLGVAALFLSLGTYLLVLAFRDVDISAVAPFRYTLLIWAAILGYVLFGEIPDIWSVFGGLLIACGGVYALHREAVRRRLLAAKSSDAH